MTQPLVSVVMPCFNAGKTLPETLQSLRAQTYMNWELIAVNDGSTDITAQLLEEAKCLCAGKLRIITQKNAGQTAAKIRAIENATGVYVALLDSDDLWHPEKLAQQVAFLEANPSVALCYTEGVYIDENSAPCGSFDSTDAFRGRCFNRLLLGNNIVASSVMLRRSVLDEVGTFDPELRACENWELWTRIAQHYEIDYLRSPLTSYRQHGNNMMKNIDKMRTYRLLTIKKNEQRYGADVNLKPVFVAAWYEAFAFFGKNYLWNLEMGKARRDLMRAIRLKPASFACYKVLVKTLLGARLNRELRLIKNRLTHE